MALFHPLSPTAIKARNRGDDIVIPANWLDATDSINRQYPTFCFQFKGRLHPTLLRNGFTKLLQHEGWSKLSARLETGPSGSLQYRVPTRFSRTLLPFEFNADVSYSEDALSNHPELVSTPSPSHPAPYELFSSDASPLHALLRPKRATTRASIVNSDRPMIALHVLSFADATLIGFTIPHVVDGTGVALILQAWGKVLAGEHPGAFFGFGANEDPLKELALQHQQQLEEIEVEMNCERRVMRAQMQQAMPQLQGRDRPQWQRPTAGGMLACGYWKMWEKFWYPKAAARRLYIKGEQVRKLHELVKGGLDEFEWVSEQDVLAAWIMKLNATGYDEASDGAINFVTALDLRRRLDATFPSSASYVHNATWSSWMPSMTSRSVISQSLSTLALQHRECLQLSSNFDHIAHELVSSAGKVLPPTVQVDSPRPGGKAPNVRAISSWVGVGFEKVDLSGAAMAGQEGVCDIGCVVDFTSFQWEEERYTNAIECRGSDGGYWIRVAAREEAIVKMEKALKAGGLFC